MTLRVLQIVPSISLVYGGRARWYGDFPPR
jgi:hypothetical protein